MFIRFEFKIFPPFSYSEREREKKSKKGTIVVRRKKSFRPANGTMSYDVRHYFEPVCQRGGSRERERERKTRPPLLGSGSFCFSTDGSRCIW